MTCHLGAGASLAAVGEGLSVETTMGFTPLDGLVMATRSGSVDPGLVLWLHALVFTGGVGEHAPAVRAGTAERLAFLGVALDPRANAAAAGDAVISAPGARVRTAVLTAREDLEMAREARALLAGTRP